MNDDDNFVYLSGEKGTVIVNKKDIIAVAYRIQLASGSSPSSDAFISSSNFLKYDRLVRIGILWLRHQISYSACCSSVMWLSGPLLICKPFSFRPVLIGFTFSLLISHACSGAVTFSVLIVYGDHKRPRVRQQYNIQYNSSVFCLIGL